MKVRNKIMCAVLLCAALSVYGATKGDPVSGMKYGAVNVLASAATLIPASSASNTVFVQNKGPNSIYCGSDNTVTTTTGIEVTSGSSLSIDIVQVGTGPALYCRANSADQTSPLNTRYLRVK